nr:protein NEDD1 [Tanacetum cinerariifolium]
MNFMDQSTSLVAISDGDPVKLFDVVKDSGDPCILTHTLSSHEYQVNFVKWNHTSQLENDHLNTVGKFHVVKPVPLPFIHKDEGKRRGSIYGFLPSTDRVLDGIFLILMMYTYALILRAECLKKGSETLLIHFRKQDIASSVFRVLIALARVVMVIDRVSRCTMMGSKGRRAISHRRYGTTTNLASGTFELHSIGWVVSPFATVPSEGSKGLKSLNGAPGKPNSIGPLFWKDAYTLSDVREETASGVAERTENIRIRAVKFMGQMVSAKNNATLINNSDDNSNEIV